jgi:two-component system OmpR family response regulator
MKQRVRPEGAGTPPNGAAQYIDVVCRRSPTFGSRNVRTMPMRGSCGIHCGSTIAAIGSDVIQSHTQPHVLAVDDDPDIRRVLSEYLSAHDFRISAVAGGAAMLKLLETELIDIVLLDLRLPGEDGMALARRIRDTSKIPIIILSGRTDEADRVMALELAADDYITKPFSTRELVARIHAVLRRVQSSEPATQGAETLRAYRFGGWELNLKLRNLTAADGRHVELTNSEFSLLCAFLSAPRQLLSRDQLLDQSRLHSLEVSDRAIDVTILRLRRKIEVDPASPQLIKTQRGLGYVFTAAVTVLR